MSDPPTSQHNPRKGFAYALIGTLFISTYYVAAKYAMAEPPGRTTGFNPQTFAFVWTLSGAVFAFVIVLVRGKLQAVRVQRRSLPNLVWLGTSTGVGMILLWSALAILDPSFASFLARILPVFVILLGVVFLKERLRAVEFLPIVVMVLGGYVSVHRRWDVVGLGVILGALGYVAFAFQRFFAKLESRRVDAEVLVFYRNGLASVLVTAWAVAGGRMDFDVAPRYWVALFIGVLCASCLGNVLTFKAFRHWTLSHVTMLSMLQPLLVLPMAYLVLDRLPVRQELLGGVLILAGAFTMAWIHFFGVKRRTGITDDSEKDHE